MITNTTIDKDIKDIAICLIQGNEKRKKRIEQSKETTFDTKACEAVETALHAMCSNVKDNAIRNTMQKKIYESIVYSIPYEYIGQTYCGRRRFYEYRKEFIGMVAKEMGMLTPRDTNGGIAT